MPDNQEDTLAIESLRFAIAQKGPEWHGLHVKEATFRPVYIQPPIRAFLVELIKSNGRHERVCVLYDGAQFFLIEEPLL